MDKKVYEIDANSILFDKEKNLWTLSGSGTIKAKWSGNYYLAYEGEDIELSKSVVVFNSAVKTINLYGTIYKINEDESIEVLTDENIIEDMVKPKFYKLGDRKYLLVARDISAENSSFQANDYLIVELDKVGNAVLTNNKINVKTFKETTLVTNDYTFDIANEILSFGEIKVDLKKIIGTTNEYKPISSTTKKGNTVPSSNNNQEPSSTTTTTATTTTTVVNGGGNGSGGSGGDDKPHSSITDNRIYQDKKLSIIKTTIGTNFLSLDYSVYDPKSEYKSLFIELENDETKNIETYFLAKNGTKLDVKGLLPNTKYNISFKYSYVDKDYNTAYDTFNIDYSIKTLLPETNIAVTKIVRNKVYFTISANDKLMYGAKVDMYVNGSNIISDTYTFTSETATDAYSYQFDISEYEALEYIELRVPKIVYASGETDTNLYIRVKI